MKLEKTKIIRDSLHGDIEVPYKFIKLINTKEFQRLRRIHQLSVANMVFPSANHTRFSHSIGTYYLMSKIVKRLKDLKIKFEKEEEELALAVALLHDIGHGPFSHCIEEVIGKNHEKWTCEIIEGDTEVREILKKEFGEEFPRKINEIIYGKSEVGKELNLFFVLKFLISSQLDADRLDYLVRDSTEIGVNLGKVDLDRIINGIRVTEYKDKIYTCILEKNVIDIENYLLARYYMYNIVYYNPIKCEYEKIISLIFERVKELKGSIKIPKNIRKIIEPEIKLKDYIEMDDYDIISEFKLLMEVEDIILKRLCEAIVYRKKFDRIDILSNEGNDINKFKEELKTLYGENSIEIEKILKYCFLEFESTNKIYKKKENESIKVLKNNGVVVDIEELLEISNKGETKKYNFIDRELLLEILLGKKKIEFSEKLDLITSKFNSRNLIEIERKFYLEKEIKKEEILRTIKEYSENIVIGSEYIQEYVDEYYDFENKFIKNKISCRIRKDCKTNKKVITLKKPTDDDAGRFEYEKTLLENEKIEDIASEFIDESIQKLEVVVKVKNKKCKYIAIDNGLDVRYEVSIDSFYYDELEKNHRELEIELKSEYYHRIELRELSKYISEKLEINQTKESKYERGMRIKEI
ncbi:MAG: HD domain-containing protein [Clostridium sp.]